MFLPPLQPTGGLVQATDTRVGLRGPKDKAAQLRPHGQAVRHKTRYHTFSRILVLRTFMPQMFLFL